MVGKPAPNETEGLFEVFQGFFELPAVIECQGDVFSQPGRLFRFDPPTEFTPVEKQDFLIIGSASLEAEVLRASSPALIKASSALSRFSPRL